MNSTPRTPKKIIGRQLRSTSNDLVRQFFSRKTFIKALISLVFSLVIIIVVVYIHLTSIFDSKIFENSESIGNYRVAIVFGATVWKEGPSPVLKERLDAAVELYTSEKVSRVIVSGDNSALNNEPIEMYEYLLEKGVPETSVEVDYYGFRTYDTCYRAKNEFGINEAVLVTQKFHLYRALYLCNALGVDSVGYPSDKGELDNTQWQIRDFFAFLLAVWEVNFAPPEVTQGN